MRKNSYINSFKTGEEFEEYLIGNCEVTPSVPNGALIEDSKNVFIYTGRLPQGPIICAMKQADVQYHLTDLGLTTFRTEIKSESPSLLAGRKCYYTFVFSWFSNDTGAFSASFKTGLVMWLKSDGRTIFAGLDDRFRDCTNLEIIDFNGFTFRVESTKSANGMFANCYKLWKIKNFDLDTSEITDMRMMFHYCGDLTSVDLSKLKTGNVELMDSMFAGCSKLYSLDLSSMDCGKVTSMEGMFEGCNALTGIKASENFFSNVNNCSKMFRDCTNLTSVDLTSMAGNPNDIACYTMFLNCNRLLRIIVPTKKRSIHLTGSAFSMFQGVNQNYSGQELNLCCFDVSNVTDMGHMFYETRFPTLDLSNWDTTKVTNMKNMFGRCPNIARLILSPDFFNSTTVTKYDFWSMEGWNEPQSIRVLAQSLMSHDGTGKEVAVSLTTYGVLTEAEKTGIQAKGWTITHP